MRPRLDHIFIQLGPALPTPPSLPGLPKLPAHTCMGTFPRWEPMRQYHDIIYDIIYAAL
jgi:hypothetical protein